MSIQRDIINYLKERSRGIINLTEEDATKIISMVKDRVDLPYAILFRFNMATRVWDQQLTVKTSNEAIMQRMAEALNKIPPKECYKWDCYNSKQEFECTIYTLDINLF